MATRAGVHAHDAELENFTPLTIQAEIAQHRGFLDRLARIEAVRVGIEDRVDLEMARGHANRALFELQDMEVWKRRPDWYVRTLADSVAGAARLEFAGAERRFASLVARLKLLPRVLEQARLNISGQPAALSTRRAIDLLPRVADFVEKDLPHLAGEQGAGRRIQQQVAREALRAAAALRDFQKWLAAEILPRSTSKAALGAELYARWYRTFLGSVLAPAAVVEAAEAEIEKAMPSAPRPSAGTTSALAVYRAAVADVRQFVRDKKLVPLPAPDRLRVVPAPAWWLSGDTELDAPGIFESDLAYTLGVPANADPAVAASVAAHEAYPGRYVQLAWMQRSQRLARKVFASPAFTEGWAHYAVLMLAENGYPLDAPTLSRRWAAAAIADIRLHSGEYTPEAAAEFLSARGGWPEPAARALVDHSLLEPAALAAPFAGRLEIVRLREELRKKRGPAFSLYEFHEALLALGAPPLHHARALLLGGR